MGGAGGDVMTVFVDDFSDDDYVRIPKGKYSSAQPYICDSKV